MKRRIIAILLGLCLVLSLLFGGVFAVPDRKSTAYDGDIDKKATVNPLYLSSSSIAITVNPENVTNWATAPQVLGEELSADLVVAIRDVYVSEDQGVYWYQIEAVEGSLPETMATNNWIMQGFVGDAPEICTLLLQEEPETDPDASDPEVSDPDASDPDASDPDASDPDASDPDASDPDASDPDASDPDASNPDEEDTQPEWTSYFDYIAAQAEKTFADPGQYVGYDAAFAVNAWTSFQYAADPAVSTPADGENIIANTDVTDAQGNSICVKIIGYAVDAEGQIWYQIEAADGYSLPAVLVDNPYILQLMYVEDIPSLTVLPLQGMFVGETVEIKQNSVAAAKSEILPVAELPLSFDVFPVGVDADFYDLGNTNGWHENLTDKNYRYVDATSVMLIAPEVSVAYTKLMNTNSAAEYSEIWESLPESVRNQFSEKHLAQLAQQQTALHNVTRETTVDYNGTALNVSVTGPIPKSGVELHVSAVSGDTVLAEGFSIWNTANIITALDVKLLQEDSTEWQPAEGEFLELSIDMAALGCPDGKVVRLHHKHNGRINVQDVFVVMNGKLTIRTSGFSIYVVENVGNTQAGSNIQNTTIEIEIGKTIVLYNNNNANGTWRVNDPEGAIHYTVHSNDATSSSIGHNQVRAQWIKIVGLKKTTSRITLTFSRGNRDETCYLNVVTPKAESGKKRLYIKDEVNSSGCLVAAVVDAQGNETSLEGAAFSWTRDDGLFIVPAAYEQNYKAVNIARDHGGLVEARKKADDTGYQPTTYKLKVILADGTELEASYTVYYQSEIINAGFEFPDSNRQNYSFFPNGYPELYWKTTAPGTGSGNITKDIEYGDVTDLTANNTNVGGTSYGVWKAADYASGGVQFAELNAEEVGALYQDIISVPDEDIVWDFCHARRPNATNNKMYIVIGATEDAQKLSNDQLNKLVQKAARTVGNKSELNGTVIEYDNAYYCVWYHDADDQTDYSASANYGWEQITGSYRVPEKQYRTRLFFVSDPDAGTQNKNYGNLIDVSRAGQYKTYLIEYYEETFDENGNKTVTHLADRDESGEAIIYSSVILKNFDYFIKDQHDYLHVVNINGLNYPYDLRYSGHASLYIEKYKEAENFDPDNKYSQYGIVMQLYFRDTVIAGQKELVFPEALTDEQELTIITDLNNKHGGYDVTLNLEVQTGEDNGTPVFEPLQEGGEDVVDTATITARNPDGSYTSYVSVGDNPSADNKTYRIKESSVTQIPGLELDKVKISVVRYKQGEMINGDLKEKDHTEIEITDIDDSQHYLEGIYSPDIKLENHGNDEDDIRIADVIITNTYREKMTTIYYKAVGNGKVSLAGATEFTDTPTEELAFYSGKSVGVEIHKGAGAVFVGWFKDEACTKPVTDADGVVDSNYSFKPNANIINQDEITFYAKFDTASIVINRTGAEAGQTFVYHVSGTTDGPTSEAIDLYLTLTCGADGSGTEKITEVPNGTYTITEISDWSWRFASDPANPAKTVTVNAATDHLQKTVTFTGAIQKEQWLSGLADVVKNIFNQGGAA